MVVNLLLGSRHAPVMRPVDAYSLDFIKRLPDSLDRVRLRVVNIVATVCIADPPGCWKVLPEQWDSEVFRQT